MEAPAAAAAIGASKEDGRECKTTGRKNEKEAGRRDGEEGVRAFKFTGRWAAIRGRGGETQRLRGGERVGEWMEKKWREGASGDS